jgi:tRNA threonylcarbamoyladenosine biosynthesis protein TsaE
MRAITESEEQTIQFGKTFAKKLKGSEVILLIGDLGAGKTTFTKGLAKGLGIKQTINSPTFVIMKEYKVKSIKYKVKTLIHIDTYRGLDIADLGQIGALEYFGQNDTVCVVEWGANLQAYLKKHKIKAHIIKINNISEEKRAFEINQYGN